MPSGLRRCDEPGDVHFWTISCFRRLGFFHIDGMKQIVVDGLQLLRQKFGVCLVGYVIMPDHVRVVLLPHARGNPDPRPISKLLNAFKQHVGFHGKKCLRDHWQAHGRLWSGPLNQWTQGGFDEKKVWSPHAYDFNINREETLVEKLEYCHKNAVTRELVDRPESWPWSSYRFYELSDRSMLSMDWDRQWPIVW